MESKPWKMKVAFGLLAGSSKQNMYTADGGFADRLHKTSDN